MKYSSENVLLIRNCAIVFGNNLKIKRRRYCFIGGLIFVITLAFVCWSSISYLLFNIPEQNSFVIYISDGTNHCGGTLIQKNYILTAAHCVDNFNEIVLKLRGSSSEQQFIISGKNIIKHPEYDKKSRSNDIALIRLPNIPTDFDTVSLADPKYITECCTSEEPAVLLIWGNSSSDLIIPKKVNLTKCLTGTNQVICQLLTMTESTFCSESAKNDLCSTTPGGPLLWNDTQIGIVSSDEGCDRYITYTNIFYYLQWIKENTSEEKLPVPTGKFGFMMF